MNMLKNTAARLLMVLFALAFAVNANAQFSNGQVLTAGALNAALAAPTITGGSITNAPISGSSGSFTTLSASGTVSGAGFTNYFASPPALGGATPNSAAFTTLSASSTLSGIGFTNYFASPPCVGCTTPAAGHFTTLSATGTSTLADVTATSVTNSALTANSFTYPSTGGLMASTSAATNGQVLIGSTGNPPVAATITGTSNQISIANGAGSITFSLPSTLAVPGTVTSYNGVATAGGGVPIIVADTGTTYLNKTANFGPVTLYTVPSGQDGWYAVIMRGVVTTPASTSSTLPNTTIAYTDFDSGGTPNANIGATNGGNTANTANFGIITVYGKALTGITAQTTGYASNPANAMAYSVRYIVEYLGP